MGNLIEKVTKALILAGFSWLVFFHVYRYVWILQVIKRDGSILCYEPDIAMLNFELVIGFIALVIIILATGFIVGKVTK